MFLFSGRRNREYQPIRRSSLDGATNSLLSPLDVEEGYEKFHSKARISATTLLGYICINPYRLCGLGRGKWKRLCARIIFLFFLASLVLLVITPIFNPSYSTRPQHYKGSNPHDEKVYIAANILDEDLIRGAWGNAVQRLVELIGPENAYLSVYENDSGPSVKAALQELSDKIKCRSNIISGHIDVGKFPTVQILPSDNRVKRITYLAEVRNHAIEPIEYIDASNTTSSESPMNFDKLLFLNDVVFSPKDAADLLFSTNVGIDGRTNYHAVCAMDFINPIKFYDRFAMRDNEYFETGLPFFPWFVAGGKRADSWNDVMAQKDAVRVKSCWGGMVAFEAKWFRKNDVKKGLEPLRFRSEPDTFWDASECCLIHADLEQLVQKTLGQHSQARIYVNPYIRVAYDTSTFAWLGFTRRFERLYTLPHMMIGWFIHMPWASNRRLEPPDQQVFHREWTYRVPEGIKNADSKRWTVSDIPQFGVWQTNRRLSKPGGYCGFPFLLALKSKKQFKPGERKWEKIFAPPGMGKMDS